MYHQAGIRSGALDLNRQEQSFCKSHHLTKSHLVKLLFSDKSASNLFAPLIEILHVNYVPDRFRLVQSVCIQKPSAYANHIHPRVVSLKNLKSDLMLPLQNVSPFSLFEHTNSIDVASAAVKSNTFHSQG